VAAGTIVWANSAFANAWPGGTRDPAEWYYCHAQQLGSSYPSDWHDLVCEQILWQEVPGGGEVYESVQLWGTMTAQKTGVDNVANRVRGAVIPPHGMKRVEYACIATATECSTGAGSRSGGAKFEDGGVPFSTNNEWSVSVPSAPDNQCTTNTVDVVHWSTADYDDAFWTEASWIDNWTDGNTWPVTYPYFEASAGSNDADKTVEGHFECTIVDWEDWPSWLETNPPWVPGPGDLVVQPTPTPSAGFPITITPLVPVSNTVNLVIGQPGTPECTTIIPSGGISQTVFGYEIDSGWADYEICAQPTEFQLEFFGIDFSGLLLLAFGAMAVGVVFKFFRTG
jgi:hypothetical protein